MNRMLSFRQIIPQEIAQSEILEECGYDVPLASVVEVQGCFSSVGIGGERMTLFYAEVEW